VSVSECPLLPRLTSPPYFPGRAQLPRTEGVKRSVRDPRISALIAVCLGVMVSTMPRKSRIEYAGAKGAPEKKVLVWYVRSRTSISNDWLSEHVHCGRPANIRRCINAVKDKKNKLVQRLVKKMLECEGPYFIFLRN